MVVGDVGPDRSAARIGVLTTRKRSAYRQPKPTGEQRFCLGVFLQMFLSVTVYRFGSKLAIGLQSFPIVGTPGIDWAKHTGLATINS